MKKMNRKCAYCGSSGKLTKEHVIPDFLYEFAGRGQVGYNAKASKVVKSEHKVKDVCKECNNIHLSKLDSYGKELFNDNGLDKYHAPDLSISFNFDYELLLRFLLKLSYNQSRMTNKMSYLYSNLKDYILYGSQINCNKNLRLFLEVLSHYKLTSEDKVKLEKRIKNTIYQKDEIGDFMYHEKYAIGHIEILNQESFNSPDKMPPSIPASYVAINSFFFSLIYFDENLNKQEIDSFLRNDIPILKYVKRLTHQNQSTKIKVSRRNISNHLLVQASFNDQKSSWDEYHSNTAYLDKPSK